LNSLALALHFAAAASPADDQRLQVWFLAQAQSKVLERGWVYIEFQPRFTLLPGDKAKVDQLFARTAIGWEVLPSLVLWLGGAIVNSEQRIFEQVTWSRVFGDFKFSVRGRFEQRWLPDDPTVRLRARVQLRLAWTFTGPFLLILYEEPFVNFTPVAFDQNRLSLMLGIRPHPKVLFELGYLNQLFTNRIGHTLMGTLGVGF
jgi:hypothetical protein